MAERGLLRAAFLGIYHNKAERREDDHLIIQGKKYTRNTMHTNAWGTLGQLAQLSVESVNVDLSLLIYWVLRKKKR